MSKLTVAVRSGRELLSRLLSRRAKPRVAPPPAARRGLPRVVLSGFFGRGNVGDEALLHVQYELLRPHFDVVLSVEPAGVHPDYLRWRPYDRCRIIDWADVEIFREPDVVALHIGGGDLPLGFNGGQALAAAAAGKPVFTTGVDFSATYRSTAETRPTLLRNLFQMQDWIAPRSRSSWDFVESQGGPGGLGADWAFGLRPEPPSVQERRSAAGTVLIVLREFPFHVLTEAYQAGVERLVSALRERKTPFAFLPFCPADDAFLQRIRAARGAPRLTCWRCPGTVRRWIGEAAAVLSVGRLHPLIFAACAGTPFAFAEPTLAAGDVFPQRAKALALREEVDFPYFSSIDPLVEGWQAMERRPGPRFSEGYRLRFETMRQGLLARLQAAAERVVPLPI